MLEQAPVIQTTPSPPGHDAAMVAKVDASAAAALAAAGATSPAAPTASPAVTRPDHIPEKFWDATKGAVNVEAMAKSYTELEKAGVGKAQPAAATPTDAAPTATPADAAAVVGEDAFAAYSTEFSEKGTLSEESFKALEAKGIPKPMVEAYIAGQMALADRQTADIVAPAGGIEGFTKMSEWATKTLPQADIDTLNAQLESPDLGIRKNAVVALKARYDAAYGGSAAGMVQGEASAGTVGYASTAEMTKDMRDPRYASDPAFRRQVEAKLSVTNSF